MWFEKLKKFEKLTKCQYNFSWQVIRQFDFFIQVQVVILKTFQLWNKRLLPSIKLNRAEMSSKAQEQVQFS